MYAEKPETPDASVETEAAAEKTDAPSSSSSRVAPGRPTAPPDLSAAAFPASAPRALSSASLRSLSLRRRSRYFSARAGASRALETTPLAASAAAGATTVSTRSPRPCAYATETVSRHFFAAHRSDAARSTSPSSRSATAAAPAGSNCSRASASSEASARRSAAGRPSRPASASAGRHAEPSAYARMAPLTSPTESNATAASSCLRSSLSWPAYAVATATRSADTGRGALGATPPTRRPRRLPARDAETSAESFSSAESLSSRSRSAATAMACGKSRLFAAKTHALSASPPLSKFSTALRQRPSLTSTSALRRGSGRACKRSSSGTYSPGSIPGARWPTRNAVLKSYVPIAASNRFLPPSSAKRWSRAASESTNE